MIRAVDSSRGLVCWIIFAGNIVGCDAEDVLSRFKERVDMLENGVNSSVAVSADAPSFNDASVVSMQYDMSGVEKVNVDSADKELEAHSFCPSDVFFSV